jgi:restriction endonuclease Mrr
LRGPGLPGEFDGKKFVLIKGDHLADLMIDHGLGVTTTKTFEI